MGHQFAVHLPYTHADRHVVHMTAGRTLYIIVYTESAGSLSVLLICWYHE